MATYRNKMQKKTIIFKMFLALALINSFMACKKEEATPVVTIKAETIKDLAADPTTISGTGQPVATGKFTFFSFKNGIVANADSATTKWDLAFRGTTILTNGGSSGSGVGGAIVKDALFTDIKEAPTTGYAQDTKALLAVPTGSGKGWYNYSSTTNQITPIAGKIIVVKTADGKYAKMEILSYYKGSPVAPDANSVARYYSFRYTYQADGSVKFE